MIKQSLFDSSHNEIKNYGDLVTSFKISNSSYHINSASENRVHMEWKSVSCGLLMVSKGKHVTGVK